MRIIAIAFFSVLALGSVALAEANCDNYGPLEVNSDEDCYTLGEVVRRLASLHQYGGDMDEFIEDLAVNGIDPGKLEYYRRIASDMADSPKLLIEADREFAIEYHVEYYKTLCMRIGNAPTPSPRLSES